MITTAQIKTLKQTNISIAPEMTKERVKRLWKSAKNAEKNDVAALAGCSKPSIYRIYDTGSISIKLALAIGSVLNANPYYLTGEAEQAGEYSEELLLQMLGQYGYTDLLAELTAAAKPKRKYTRKAKPTVEEAPV